MMSTGPLRMDPHAELRVRAATRTLYQAAAAEFTAWLADNFLTPSSAEQWDDCLIEYKNDPDVELSKTHFLYTISAVEFFFPRYKGGLKMSKAAIAGWEKSEPGRHTVPLDKTMAKLVGCHMSARLRHRMGVAVILQTHAGLRPSELLALQAEDVSFPWHSGESYLQRPTLLAIGVKRGTKSGRTQVSKIMPRDWDVAEVLARVVQNTPRGCRLFPFSAATYRNEIRLIDQFLGIQAGWTPHSPRAGYATDSLSAGVPFEEIREVGRWAIDASLRRYLGEVSAAHTHVRARAGGLGAALAWVSSGWRIYFQGPL